MLAISYALGGGSWFGVWNIVMSHLQRGHWHLVPDKMTSLRHPNSLPGKLASLSALHWHWLIHHCHGGYVSDWVIFIFMTKNTVHWGYLSWVHIHTKDSCCSQASTLWALEDETTIEGCFIYGKTEEHQTNKSCIQRLSEPIRVLLLQFYIDF